MTKIKIERSDGVVYLRKKRSKTGVNKVTISLSIPKELNQRINGILVKDETTRSKLITDILTKALSKENKENE